MLALAHPTSVTERWSAAVRHAVDRQHGQWRRTATGESIGAADHRPGRLTEAVTRAAELRRTLRSWIYLDVHLGGAEPPSGTGRCPQIAAAVADRRHERAPSPGWVLSGREPDGQWLVGCPTAGSGPVLRIGTDDVLQLGSGTVTIALPRVRPEALPGWTSVTSRTGAAAGSSVRIYLHLETAAALPPILAALDSTPARWTLKVANRPGGLDRPDSCVVYLAEADLDTVLTTSIRSAQTGLAASTPGFAHRVAPGVAVGGRAPGRQRASFGAEVSDAAAEALVSDRPLSAALGPLAAALPRLDRRAGTGVVR